MVAFASHGKDVRLASGAWRCACGLFNPPEFRDCQVCARARPGGTTGADYKGETVGEGEATLNESGTAP